MSAKGSWKEHITYWTYQFNQGGIYSVCDMVPEQLNFVKVQFHMICVVVVVKQMKDKTRNTGDNFRNPSTAAWWVLQLLNAWFTWHLTVHICSGRIQPGCVWPFLCGVYDSGRDHGSLIRSPLKIGAPWPCSKLVYMRSECRTRPFEEHIQNKVKEHISGCIHMVTIIQMPDEYGSNCHLLCSLRDGPVVKTDCSSWSNWILPSRQLQIWSGAIYYEAIDW